MSLYEKFKKIKNLPQLTFSIRDCATDDLGTIEGIRLERTIRLDPMMMMLNWFLSEVEKKMP